MGECGRISDQYTQISCILILGLEGQVLGPTWKMKIECHSSIIIIMIIIIIIIIIII